MICVVCGDRFVAKHTDQYRFKVSEMTTIKKLWVDRP